MGNPPKGSENLRPYRAELAEANAGSPPRAPRPPGFHSIWGMTDRRRTAITASGSSRGQRLTQAASDIMLGWIRMTAYDGVSRAFYVRQLWDGKGSALVDLMNPPAMTVYAEVCGRALAKAHARSGDAIAIASYLGAATASIVRSPRSRRPTPTRTSATTTRCVRRSRPVASRPRQASDRARVTVNPRRQSRALDECLRCRDRPIWGMRAAPEAGDNRREFDRRDVRW